jgi:hypothetical protein
MLHATKPEFLGSRWPSTALEATLTANIPALKAPSKLGPAGRALWKGITEGYSLRADERRVVEDAAREADLIEQLQTALNDQMTAGKLFTRGSMGQDVINPLVAEVRQHRATLAGLLRALKLPDDAAPVTGEKPRSVANRAAANARWAKRGA